MSLLHLKDQHAKVPTAPRPCAVVQMDDVRQNLLAHWGIDSPLHKDASGGSRCTWRVDAGYWLTMCGLERETTFRKETSLLKSLRISLERQGTAIAVPETQPTTNGDDFFVDHRGVWRLTRHIAGVKHGADDLRTYPCLAKALEALHAALREPPLDLAPTAEGVVDIVAAGPVLERSAPRLREAMQWLQPRIGRLCGMARQITHGDFNPTNILYADGDGPLAVSGIVDFELSRPDPVIMDYSQLLTMLVCHSGVTNLRKSMDERLAVMGCPLGSDELQVAALAYWTELCIRWQGSEAAESKLLRRLGQVWDFIHAAA